MQHNKLHLFFQNVLHVALNPFIFKFVQTVSTPIWFKAEKLKKTDNASAPKDVETCDLVM